MKMVVFGWRAGLGSLVALLISGCDVPARKNIAVHPLAEIDWNAEQNLTNHEYWDFDPNFSPDGEKIAFHSTRPPSPGNRGQIYVMNADGSDPVALTHTDGTNYGAAWSPDGSKIAFTSERDGNSEIYVMNADGSEQKNISNNPDGYDAGPDWSPDGRYLAFFTGMQKPKEGEVIPPGEPYRYWNADLFIVDMQTGDKKQLTFSDNDDIYPVWSSDSKMIAFTSSRDGNNEIYMINVDGSDERRITYNEKSDNAAAWLPGDKYISFNDFEVIDGGDRANIYVVNVDSGEIIQVTDRSNYIYFNGDVSPDGDSFAYAAFTQDETAFRGERADIYVVKRSK